MPPDQPDELVALVNRNDVVVARALRAICEQCLHVRRQRGECGKLVLDGRFRRTTWARIYSENRIRGAGPEEERQTDRNSNAVPERVIDCVFFEFSNVARNAPV